MPIDPTFIVHAFGDHWPQVFTYALFRDAAKPIVRYLQDHYRHDSPETLQQAAGNASDLAHRVETKVKAMIELGQLTDEQLAAALDRPDVAKMLQQAFLDASESASEFQHQQLAEIIAAHLATTSESFKSRVLRMAAERIRFLADRHLSLLGLIYTLQHTPVQFGTEGRTLEEQYQEYISACDMILESFHDVEPSKLDFMHLEGLSMLKNADLVRGKIPVIAFSSLLLRPLYGQFSEFMAAANGNPSQPISRSIAMMNNVQNGGVPSLSAFSLLPSGYVIGMAVYARYFGWPIQLDEFA